MFFNILAVILYKCFLKIIGDCGTLISIADDVKICGPPHVLAAIISKLPAMAMSEAGLRTQASKNKVFVPPLARASWVAYLEASPRGDDTNCLYLHDIPDGRLPPPTVNDEAFYAPFTGPSWPANDGVNILGTPSGSPTFVKEYLQKKINKHQAILSFITDVVKLGHSREAHKMLTWSAVPRFTHVLKSVPKDEASPEWMASVDEAHL